MYSILIKEKPNTYRFLTVKEEIMKEVVTEVTDPDTNEVRNETTLVGTGEYQTVIFTTKDKEELETKCVETLNTYNATEFIPVNTEEYSMDLVWKAASNT